MDSESAVGVGSIAHILKTAFKSVYDEEQLIKDANEAAENRRLLDAEKAIQAVKLAAIAEAEGVAKAKLDVKKDKKSSVAKGGTPQVVPFIIEAPILGKHQLVLIAQLLL